MKSKSLNGECSHCYGVDFSAPGWVDKDYYDDAVEYEYVNQLSIFNYCPDCGEKLKK